MSNSQNAEPQPTMRDQITAFGGFVSSVETATTQLFNLPMHSLDADASTIAERAVYAALSFVGPALRGTVSVIAAEPVVRAIEPMDLRVSDFPEENRFQSVLAELVNMVVGRMKRDALVFGVDFNIAIPTTLVGLNLKTPGASSGYAWSCLFRTESGPLILRLDAKFAPEFALEESADPALTEGEEMFFE